MNLYGRPTAAELVAAVADFLDNDVRSATSGQVNFHARVAANVLRTVERELVASAGGVTDALADLGYADEAQLRRPSAPASWTTGPAMFCHACARWCVID